MYKDTYRREYISMGLIHEERIQEPLYKERGLRDRGSYNELTYEHLSNLTIGELAELYEEYPYVELKYDGIWGRLEIHNGSWEIYSRTGKVKASGKCKPYYDFTLIGEYIHGKHRLHTKGDFIAYDCLKYEDYYIHDYKFQYRRKYTTNAVGTLCGDEDREFLDGKISLQKSTMWDSYQWESLWNNHIEESGWEGIVFKKGSAYYDDKHANIRVKKECEVDYVCIGFDMADPESKYAGQVGAVRGSLIDRPCDVKCGGLSEEERDIYTRLGEAYIGKVFTAKGNGWFPSGSVRHPKFSRWREDKAMTDCGYSQIPEGIRES